jgi:nucleotide-binding universal stress UspA family protein
MRVVIGIDHSPHSDAAIAWVKRATWPAESKFWLVSAVPIEAGAYVYAEAGGFSGLETMQQEQMTAHRELTGTAERDLRASGLTVETRVELGDPRELLVRTADAVGADLVVVGSHGRTGLPRLVMGSVASYVVSHAHCDVMVIKRTKRGPVG